MKKAVLASVFVFSSFFALKAGSVNSDMEEVDFNRYIGVCLDGYRFEFEADNYADAQAFVNSYCAQRREQTQN
ncbi:hypothetical protein [Roseivirga spongicola]|uniref:hypothetical protein n=1 Tax=Roseivirga spongicola TaxID=333140 RepID=UPI002AC8A6F0|nr:hypothetical protein [Roseivirga spongicola]WPZ08570.1 hypothetical protein T7867_09880 [Roseivirga spongicola]